MKPNKMQSESEELKAKTSEPQNLMEGLFAEMNRCRELKQEYLSLPRNAGAFATMMIEIAIKSAEKAIAENNVIKMLKAYSDLQEFKD